ISRVAVAVEKGLELLVAAQESIEDSLRRERGRQREITTREPLGKRQEIGLDTLVMRGKQILRRRSATAANIMRLAAVTGRRCGDCSPKPRHHFVRDEQRAVRLRDSRDLTQPAGRLGNHPSRSLNQRFKHKTGVWVAA